MNAEEFMAVKTAAKLRKKAAKARKRNESEKAWRQRLAVPRVLDPADCRVSWVLSGERLDDRPAPLFLPGPPPASAKSGRWVSRRYLQIGDMLMLEGDGRSGEIVSLPANLDERPRIRVGEWKKVERVFHNPYPVNECATWGSSDSLHTAPLLGGYVAGYRRSN